MCVVDTELAQILNYEGWVKLVGRRPDGRPIIDVDQKCLDDGIFEVVGKDEYGAIYGITEDGLVILGPEGFEVLGPEWFETVNVLDDPTSS